MVTRRPSSTSHVACRYRLRFRRSTHHVWDHRCKSLDLPWRDPRSECVDGTRDNDRSCERGQARPECTPRRSRTATRSRRPKLSFSEFVGIDSEVNTYVDAEKGQAPKSNEGTHARESDPRRESGFR